MLTCLSVGSCHLLDSAHTPSLVLCCMLQLVGCVHSHVSGTAVERELHKLSAFSIGIVHSQSAECTLNGLRAFSKCEAPYQTVWNGTTRSMVLQAPCHTVCSSLGLTQYDAGFE